MPLSTSSSDFPVRHIPGRRWLRLSVTVLAVIIVLCTAWEIACRQKGYMPTLNDNPYQWARVRRQAQHAGENDMIVIGSSRGLFDLRLDALQNIKGGDVYQLSIVGSSPVLILEDLADHTNFNGTVLCSVTPALFFAPGGPPMEKPTTWLKFYREFSPAQSISQALGVFLQERLAFIQQEDLTLTSLLDLLPVRDRKDARVPPKFPPFLNTLETNRQAALLDKLSSNPRYAEKVQKIWQGLFALPPYDDAVASMMIERYNKAINKIRERGGTIIFIRPPSTEWLFEKENELTPRGKFWDRLIRETGAQGFHFQDIPAQADLPCPEWSHLTRADAIRYTQSLVPEIIKSGKEQNL